MLRFAWLGGGRHDLYAFMRSPYSGLRRDHVDFLEGRLRGRAIHTPDRVESETLRLRGQPLPFLDTLRAGSSNQEAVKALAGTMLPAAHGLGGPPTSEGGRLDLRAFEATLRALEELDAWQTIAGKVDAEDVVYALERAVVGGGPARQPGRVAVLDMLRARTRHYEIVFVLGLEEGALPRRAGAPSLLDDDARRAIEERSRRARVLRPDPVAADRYLFYTACTRATRRLYLVRESATDDGSPREPSPFWEDVRALFAADDVARWTRRRQLSEATWPMDRAPTERERLRATAALAAVDPDATTAVARANGWDRRLDRARAAFSRPTRLTHPVVLRELQARAAFGVTELEVFADCSSMWFVERVIDPRSIDARVDARLRGQVAHQALFKLFSGLPKRVGSDRIEDERLDETLVFLGSASARRWPARRAASSSPTSSGWSSSRGCSATSASSYGGGRSELPLVPRRFEVSFGSERSAPGLKAGLDLGGFAVTGKIDRVDLDPFSARGIVQDYKTRQGRPLGGKDRLRAQLQIPLYMLVLRDLLGVEPIGGLYRALAGERSARGVLRATARDELVPGFAPRDYLDDEAFWALVDQAAERAAASSAASARDDVGARPAGWRVPVVVRARAHLPGEASMARHRAPGPDPRAGRRHRRRRDGRSCPRAQAPARPGHRRALRAGGASAASTSAPILVVTFTERAAGELRSRIRARLIQSGRPISRASWTGRGSRPSTASVTGCCARIPRRPASILASACSTRARRACCARRRSASRSPSSVRSEHPERVKLLATYGADGLRRMLGGVRDAPRSRLAARARPAGGAGARQEDRRAEGSGDQGSRGDGRRSRGRTKRGRPRPAPSSCSTASRTSTSCSICRRSRSRARGRERFAT